MFEVIPAIDLLNGNCVRLTRGVVKTSKKYYSNPVDAALRFVDEGAETLHVVDLNAACGNGNNQKAISEIICAVNNRALVQAGGGVRSAEKANALFEAGVDRVVVSTSAFEKNFEEIARQGQTLVSLDYSKNGLLTKGWLKTTAAITRELFERLEKNASGFIATDIERDGTLKGARAKTLKKIISNTKKPVYAAGGVTTVEDVVRITGSGAAGVIIGKALYEGKITLKRAVEAAKNAC